MRNTFRALFVFLMLFPLIMRPVASYADWNGNNGNSHGQDDGHHDSHHDGHHDDHGHDHDRHDHSYIGVNLALWPDNYYYGAPYYPPEDDVLVSPPVYQTVAINGITYYLNNGTYYIYNGYGYQAVAPPAVVVQQPAAADSFTINIPNDKGGYTAVTLKRSGNGYIGPQGEFYPEFPKVSQLVVIYGK